MIGKISLEAAKSCYAIFINLYYIVSGASAITLNEECSSIVYWEKENMIFLFLAYGDEFVIYPTLLKLRQSVHIQVVKKPVV